ncbi:MAG: 6,7-dimethyl-8-ribityllumazine synthase [Deltaproteobacteria bacterium]|nr:MAG: 6,7-dimethyl-8-ribityllumazine synthase [Deltaproteobacteria bacterium]
MPTVVEGHLTSAGLRVAIVASRFNAFIVDRLVDGAVDALVRTGCADADIAVYRTPGAFEIPQVLRRVVDAGRYDAAVCLGAVIRGGTPHFEYVASSVTKGIAQVAATSPIPVSFGILTCDTVDQAIDRAGAKAGNKGAEAAMAAVETANLLRRLEAAE